MFLWDTELTDVLLHKYVNAYSITKNSPPDTFYSSRMYHIEKISSKGTAKPERTIKFS